MSANDIGLNFNAEGSILWTNAQADIVCMVSQYEVLTAGMSLVKCQLPSWYGMTHVMSRLAEGRANPEDSTSPMLNSFV